MELINKTFQIRTFCSPELPGSLQYLHFFSNKKKLQEAAENYVIDNEYDHSFIYLESKTMAFVKWKNKAGEIQLCGSGAFAIAWLLKHYIPSVNTIKSTLYELNIQQQNDCVFVELPHQLVKPYSHNKDLIMFSNPENGIYLLQTLSEEQLITTNWLGNDIKQLALIDAHGFCAFFWNEKKASGNLRYFVPWHGRNEDYVTGSIHQYLTPLIYDLYNASTQNWQQCSSSPGILTTFYSKKTIRLTGYCELI